MLRKTKAKKINRTYVLGKVVMELATAPFLLIRRHILPINVKPQLSDFRTHCTATNEIYRLF